MGFTSSREQLALKQAAAIRNNLYERVGNAFTTYSPAFNQIAPEKKRLIWEASAIALADMMDQGQATSLQILYVFIERVATIGIGNNYVLDEMFEEAIEQAAACDEQRKRDGGNKRCWRGHGSAQGCYPPFYGVPTSLKETFITRNRQTHCGFVSKVNPLSETDGHHVYMVRKMGFIPFVRSNVPQGCKTIDTNNNMFGYSKNPWNLLHSCGGSSGGQSGMVSSYCAPIGFGSDVGGSMRIPCAFTGLTTLKASRRFSRNGNCYFGKMSGGSPVKSQLGPMTRDMRDLILCHQFLYDPQSYKDMPLSLQDPNIYNLAMNTNQVYGEDKLRIGVVKRLKMSRCSKPVERAVNETADILKRLGHTVVDIGDLGRFEELYFFMIVLFTFDQKMAIFKDLRGSEPLTKEYRIIALISKIPWLIRKAIIWAIRKKQPRLARMLELSRPRNQVEILQKIYKCERVIAQQVYEEFAKNNIDLILMPCFVTPAPILGEAGKLQYFISFTASWNVMHYPAGTLPITVCQADELDFSDEFSDFYTKNIERTMKSAAGLPVGVQVVGRPFQEEKILQVMLQVEEEVKFKFRYHIPE